MGARRSADAFAANPWRESSFPAFLRDRGGRASCPEKSWLKHKNDLRLPPPTLLQSDRSSFSFSTLLGQRWRDHPAFGAHRLAPSPYDARAIGCSFVNKVNLHLPAAQELLSDHDTQTRPRRHSKATVLRSAGCGHNGQKPVVVVQMSLGAAGYRKPGKSQPRPTRCICPSPTHNCGGPVTHFASWHLAMATPNLKILETVRRQPEALDIAGIPSQKHRSVIAENHSLFRIGCGERLSQAVRARIRMNSNPRPPDSPGVDLGHIPVNDSLYFCNFHRR